jgi:preprotein translocase subunit SecY
LNSDRGPALTFVRSSEFWARHWRRVGVVVICLAAWCALTSLPLPGLADDAVARQWPSYSLRPISFDVIGVRPIVLALMITFLARLIPSWFDSIGDWGTVAHQRWVVVLVLLLAAVGVPSLVASLSVAGQLGRNPVDPYFVAWGVLAGTASTLGLGWVVARYGFHTLAERGWLFFYATDLLSHWVYRWGAAWHRSRPVWPFDTWPFVVEAVVLFATVSFLVLLLRSRRMVPLQSPPGGREKRRGTKANALPLKVLWANPLFAAISALVFTDLAGLLIEFRHGRPLVDPAYSGLLFLVGIGSVVFFGVLQASPIDLALNLQRFQAQIRAIRPGEPTADYLSMRKRLLTAVAAPWFAILLATPQLVELVLPARSRVGLFGVQIVLVATILLGLIESLGERKQRSEAR